MPIVLPNHAVNLLCHYLGFLLYYLLLNEAVGNLTVTARPAGLITYGCSAKAVVSPSSVKEKTV